MHIIFEMFWGRGFSLWSRVPKQTARSHVEDAMARQTQLQKVVEYTYAKDSVGTQRPQSGGGT